MDVAAHRGVQSIAKEVLAALAGAIGSEDTERTIVAQATRLLAERGIVETWYYDCPALVLLSSRSCLSISGRDYQPSDERVGTKNLVTVDLSPTSGGAWGDCARSFFIENGRCRISPTDPEFQRGDAALAELHRHVRETVRPTTPCEELFQRANQLIATLGFENLDFMGNVGHSIESNRDDRRYLAAGNSCPLAELGLFTFEPHIRQIGRMWGYKHEEIYFFDSAGRLVEL